MKSKQFYRYIGIILILVPFIGVYQYLKNTIFIVIGIILIVNSRTNPRAVKSSESKVVTRRPALRRSTSESTISQKEKEL